MAEYCCEECGKHLFDFDGNRGAAGAKAGDLGFIYKMPILYGIEGSHFFCCKDCWNKWFNDRITPDKREKGNAEWREMKEKVNKRLPKLVKDLQKMDRAFRKIRNMKMG